MDKMFNCCSKLFYCRSIIHFIIFPIPQGRFCDGYIRTGSDDLLYLKQQSDMFTQHEWGNNCDQT